MKYEIFSLPDFHRSDASHHRPVFTAEPGLGNPPWGGAKHRNGFLLIFVSWSGLDYPSMKEKKSDSEKRPRTSDFETYKSKG